MDDRGEIEFFDFVPVHFVNELEVEIQNIIKNDKILLESCKKNMFIFKNFVLRNIIKFPNTFNYERKKTDLVVDSSVDLNKYYNNILLRDNLLEKIEDMNTKIGNMKNKNNNLLQILNYEQDMKEATLNIKNIKNTYNKIMEYVCTLPFLEIDEDNFNYLLEYREIRCAILKEEWNKINKRFDY